VYGNHIGSLLQKGNGNDLPNKERMMKTFLLTLMVIVMPIRLLGAPPPWIFNNAQARSSEEVVLRIDKVIRYRYTHNRIYVKARAKVLRVVRSRNHLRRGQWITVRYTTRAKLPHGMLGAAPTPVLKRGHRYHAYLNRIRHSHSYTPAAGVASFKLIR
jgi:hypothetical protein